VRLTGIGNENGLDVRARFLFFGTKPDGPGRFRFNENRRHFMRTATNKERRVRRRKVTAPAGKPPIQRSAFKLKEAAEYLGGLSVPTMHRLLAKRRLRAVRQLRHILITREECDRWLREGTMT
jgi:excisionase family DNA binding protein